MSRKNELPEGRPTSGLSKHRESIMFTLSQELKDALDQYSGKQNEARSSVIRQAIAAFIGYDLSAEPKAQRQKKYASPEERKKAAKARSQARRELTRRLLEAYEKAEKEEDIEALIKSLKEQEDK